MKFRHLPVQAAVLMGLSGWAQAQSLVELYDAARNYDATYQSAKLLMDATISKTDQAIAGILPSVTSTAGVSLTPSNLSAPRVPVPLPSGRAGRPTDPF